MATPDKQAGPHSMQTLESLAERWPAMRVPGYFSTLAKNCEQWASDVSAGPYWSEVPRQFPAWAAEYRSQGGGELIIQALPSFVAKSESSIRSKLNRRAKTDSDFATDACTLDAAAVPRLNDLVRTRVACKYLDGVDFLALKLVQLGKLLGIDVTRERQGRVEGYFAQHLYFKTAVFYRLGGQATPTHISCEIQIATELSTRVWDVGHHVYEDARESNDQPADWQWNPKDPRFIANQLGHMIHLADGILVQVRDSALTSAKG